MFDIGFSELVVIGVVLLIVVGPERLPGVARTAGHLLGRLQRYVAGVKADIQREIQVEDLKKFQQQARELDQSLRAGINEIKAEVSESLKLTDSSVAPTDVAAPETPPVTETAAPAAAPAPVSLPDSTAAAEQQQA
ncbi:Sec-independent protein translocase protein TatB [Betaproteobacteria bacterium]|nr:Sec-independent protein translocase protein TatB [Betaproteobacteria bacterium]GHU02361.1 Sec-independent protein translocase protein TatB [Betaproteobacteria bacterium]GHU12775.1 Sec-independent protein translocase protein TatB [Betaproteobacteria bacterium]GHU24744.1 Sec-independent protein translocase protein TatB [Betaproteobacteria bacterium]